MDCGSNLDDIKDALRELKAKDHVYIQNQELCQELGKQKERANFLEQVLQNANLEIQNRDCLIEKVIKENEKLEKELKSQTQSTPKLKELCRENENFRRELECCQNVVKHLEEKYEWSVQCSQEKETFIESLEKNHAHTLEKMCCEIQCLKQDKKTLEEKLKEDKECMYMLREELTNLNEKYDILCKKLQDRTCELENMKIEYENYRRSVEIIKDYVMKNKIVPGSKTCNQNDKEKPTTTGMECPKREHPGRWKQKHTGHEDSCSNNENVQLCNGMTRHDSKPKMNFSKTYINARKRMSALGNNNHATIPCSPDVGTQKCNYSSEMGHKSFLSPEMGNKGCYSPEAAKHGDTARMKSIRARCSSESNIQCRPSADVYAKYDCSGGMRAKSTFKRNYRTGKFIPAAVCSPCHPTMSYRPSTPASYRVSCDKKETYRKSSSEMHKVQSCGRYQSLRMAVCHAATNDSNVIERLSSGPPEAYQPRPGKHLEAPAVMEDGIRGTSESQVEIETKVQNLSVEKVSPTLEECIQQAKERSKTHIKDIAKKKFKFF